MNAPQDQYKIDAIQTASADQLGLMLFEAALRSAKECQKSIAQQDWNDTVRHGRLVQDIMANLGDSINPDNPESHTMRDLYLFCWRSTINAQVNHNAEDLNPVIEVLNNLIEGLRGHIHRATTQSNTAQEVSSINFAG